MEIIEELEPTRRGLYGGVVGYFGFGGDMDTAIAIRTALIRDGVAYVQAGAGIVADSDPAAEETGDAQQSGRGTRGDRRSRVTAPGSMTFLRSRRGFALVIIACVVASALVLFGASRTWSHVVTDRPAPFPPLTTERTGASLEPWLPALAIVGLAGAGALVALRGRLRAILGIVLIALGGAISGLAASSGNSPLWPTACILGGLVLALAGMATVRCYASWPAMGARYERPAGQPERKPVTQAELWDALDRGEDPTR